VKNQRPNRHGGGDQPYWVIDAGEGAIGNAAGQMGAGAKA
jgi:hypothetical protein